MSETPQCPDCGSPLAAEDGWSEELCPHCLLRLALAESSGDEAGVVDPELTPAQSSEALVRGKILGNRYGIRALLGRGGMGEVWRAFDLKLRVDVALKTVRSDLAEQQRVLETLRQEVRAARKVVSANVCRVYDLQEFDGRELVSMEYVDGTTLLEVLRQRGPLELQEAREIAAQFLAGLDAIHQAGLVHRDIKPENLMLTPAGRVVVMDFGIAKGLAAGRTGTVAGTPAYMAPEQSRGEAVDARADVFSAGMVLAEMLAPGVSAGREARESLWRGARQDPPQLPDSPWRTVLEIALAHRREHRHAAASALARALEEVTIRVEGAEDVLPYPGLVAFSKRDREYFFGRELEVEALWRKIRRLSMMALIGPSGAGKTSFLRAGLLAIEPDGWAHVIFTPGEAPLTALRQAMVPELSGDSEAMRDLVKVEDPEAMVSAVSSWRRRSKHALLVVDQFEELFTLNPPEVQADFAELLGRLALDSDLKVLLSLRDDFLIHCHAHEALKPILSELTVLGPPAGAALRRALIQPALKVGYRFEDEALVDTMLSEVEGERGALPMVAFTASQLWQRRDRDQGLLTREAYELIGGVGGSLAQHAELTLERIGTDHVPIVRELFRNLVTAQGTRAVRDRDELLSVFGRDDRATAAKILDHLIDARLLTSYGVEAVEGRGETQQRIEIVHESLLSAWPRLVRWLAQDVEGARMRDDLRLAARRWQERDRSDDLLWVGSAFREYQLWRERYPGSLSEIEQAFARAMEMLATRRRRRRRTAVGAGFAILAAVLLVVTGLWRESVQQTRRAEASKLVAIGQSVLEEDRTRALAFAIASLELADTPAGRRLALRALCAGPPATMIPVLPLDGRSPLFSRDVVPLALAVSPDGRHIAAGYYKGVVRVFPRDGGVPVTLQAFEEDQGTVWALSFSRDGRLLVGSAVMADGEVRVWETGRWQLDRVLRESVPPGSLVHALSGHSVAYGLVDPDLTNVWTATHVPAGGDEQSSDSPGHWRVRRWPLDGGPSELVGEVAATTAKPCLDLSRGLLVAVNADEIHLHRLSTLGREPPRVVGRRGPGCCSGPLAIDLTRERLAVGGEERSLSVWPLAGDGTRPERVLELEKLGEVTGVAFSPDGSRLAQCTYPWGARLWDLRGPAFAEPLHLGVAGTPACDVAFTPDGRWLVTADSSYLVSLWPASHPYPRLRRIDENNDFILGAKFHPDGSRFIACYEGDDGVDAVLSWPMSAGAGLEPEVLFRDVGVWVFEIDPQGRFIIVGTDSGVRKIPLDGGAETMLGEVPVGRLELGPTGRYLAYRPSRKGGTVAVLDLETHERLELEPPGDGSERYFRFHPDGRLLFSRGGVISSWDRETRATEVLLRTEGDPIAIPLGDGRRVYIYPKGIGVDSILDLEDGSLTPLPQAHQVPDGPLLFDRTGSIVVSGHADGEIRVGPIFGEEPHLLLGSLNSDAHPRSVSPDGRWIVSHDGDGTFHLWPMPDLSKPPFHTLPYGELMARLEALTNLRLVPDEDSSTGYGLTPDVTAYRGWAEVPEW